MFPPRHLALLALSFAGCGRGCGCIAGERVYESIGGAVRVELVRNVHWTGGRFPGPITTFYVRVHATPRIDESVPCDHVDMAQNPNGSLIAFRCRGTLPWSLIRRQPDGAWFRECDAPVGTAATPDFARVEPLSASATRIATCPSERPPARVWPVLLRAIAASEGNDRAAATVVSLAHERWPPRRPYFDAEDPWPGALSELPEALRTAGLRRTCAAMTEATPSAPLWVRAAPRCPLEGSIADAALRAFVPWLATSNEYENESDTDDEALRWSAAIASTYRPEAAGIAACEAARTLPPSFHRDGTLLAIGAVLAITRTRCPAFERWSTDLVLCGRPVECDGGLCSEATLTEDLSSWRRAVMAPPGSPWRSRLFRFETHRVALAVAYAQGELSREVSLRNARYRYELPTDNLPECTPNLANGTPCTCPDLSLRLCGVPASTQRAEVGSCAFTFDDARRRIIDVRSTCQPAGGSCAGERVCCSGTECAPGPDARCVVRRDAGT